MTIDDQIKYILANKPKLAIIPSSPRFFGKHDVHPTSAPAHEVIHLERVVSVLQNTIRFYQNEYEKEREEKKKIERSFLFMKGAIQHGHSLLNELEQQ